MIDEGVDVVRHLIAEHLRSPSLRHIRDAHSVDRLAREIVRRLGRASVWRKWEGAREGLMKAAAPCWIPVDVLLDYLNGLPGPKLSRTDLMQRMRAYGEEPYAPYPKEELRTGCLEIFERERCEGTEFPAIIGAIQEFVEHEEDRLRHERQTSWKAKTEQARIALEKRFLSGADCKWTPVRKSKDLYCRINGRTYRLSPTPDKLWCLSRISSPEDLEGPVARKYRFCGDATKALTQIAYQHEPRH